MKTGLAFPQKFGLKSIKENFSQSLYFVSRIDSNTISRTFSQAGDDAVFSHIEFNFDDPNYSWQAKARHFISIFLSQPSANFKMV